MEWVRILGVMLGGDGVRLWQGSFCLTHARSVSGTFLDCFACAFGALAMTWGGRGRLLVAFRGCL